jgi:hypothetical protein
MDQSTPGRDREVLLPHDARLGSRRLASPTLAQGVAGSPPLPLAQGVALPPDLFLLVQGIALPSRSCSWSPKDVAPPSPCRRRHLPSRYAVNRPGQRGPSLSCSPRVTPALPLWGWGKSLSPAASDREVHIPGPGSHSSAPRQHHGRMRGQVALLSFASLNQLELANWWYLLIWILLHLKKATSLKNKSTYQAKMQV